MSKGNHFSQSKRELMIILSTWAVFCAWVVGYCSAFGYHREGEELEIVLGMPAWVVWGIALPWLVATVFTVIFGMKIMKDRPLDVVEGEG